MDDNWANSKAEGVKNYKTKSWDSKVEVTYAEKDQDLEESVKRIEASDYNKKKEQTKADIIEKRKQKAEGSALA